MILLIVLLFILILYIKANNDIPETVPYIWRGHVLSFYLIKYLKTTLNYVTLYFIIISVIFCALGFIYYSVFRFCADLLIDRLLFWKLFNSAPYKAYYIKLLSATRSDSYIKSRKVHLLILLILFFILIVIALLAFISSNFNDNVLLLILSFGLPLIVLPLLLSNVKVYKDATTLYGVDPPGLHRYMLYLFSHITLGFICVIVGLQLFFPLLLRFNDHMIHNHLRPNMNNIESVTCSKFSQYKPQNADDDRKYIYLLEIFNKKRNDINNGIITADFNLYLFQASKPIIGLLVVGLGIPLFFTYCFLVGWVRGLFYVILIFTAFLLDNILQTKSPSWFLINPSNIESKLIVGFVILSSALFIDWFYKILTDRYKTCPNCNKAIDENEFYCQYCGFME